MSEARCIHEWTNFHPSPFARIHGGRQLIAATCLRCLLLTYFHPDGETVKRWERARIAREDFGDR